MSFYRPLEPKQKYDRYFEKTGCKAKELGYGYTEFGVKQMKNWATKYAYQTNEIAKLLLKNNIIETLENVHQFIYNNFQYSPDYSDQHIQSPACAWQMREKGINCKGYSIIASSILQQLGIRHFIRRVSYDGNEFVHVFVVVPVNDKEIIIDGTIPQFNYTPEYKLKNDIEVMPQKLRYIGLNAAQSKAASLKDLFLTNLYKLGLKKGIENIGQVVDFIDAIPENDTFRVTPFGIKYQSKYVPFKFKNVDKQLLLSVVSQYLQPKGMNFAGGFGSSPFDTGAGAFGYDTGGTGNFGVDLNLGSGTGSSGTIREGVKDWIEIIGKAWEVGSDILSGNSDNSGNAGNGHNTQYPPPYVNNGNTGNTGNTGVTGGIHYSYPPAYSGSGHNNQPQPDKKWYEKPVNIALGLLGIGAVAYTVKNKKNK